MKLIKHKSQNLETPIVNNIKSTFKGGTARVLIRTNEEALRIAGLLIKEGYRAKPIQSNDGFILYNLAEFRSFMKVINKEAVTPIISDEI